ncbi:hypothetical protein SDC9_100761 [bioreactor metagenome]|uniref:Uncharacterized protein n=1 Tax=bioreactor metagenome TaxID=1076179 RepID=A0A645ALG4_9ZZZZ
MPPFRTLFVGEIFCLVLDMVELCNEVNAFCGQLLVFSKGIKELPSGMSPTAEHFLALHALKAFVCLIPIGLDGAIVVLQQFECRLGASGTKVIVENDLSGVRIAHDPHVAFDRTVLFIVDYRQCALIHLDVVAVENIDFQPVIEKLELLTYSSVPVSHCRTAYIDAKLPVFLYDPVEGHMVEELFYYYVRQYRA